MKEPHETRESDGIGTSRVFQGNYFCSQFTLSHSETGGFLVALLANCDFNSHQMLQTRTDFGLHLCICDDSPVALRYICDTVPFQQLLFCLGFPNQDCLTGFL